FGRNTFSLEFIGLDIARCERSVKDVPIPLGRILKPPPPDRGPSRLRGRSHFGAAKARSAAAELVERRGNAPDHLDRATCCGRDRRRSGGSVKAKYEAVVNPLWSVRPFC